MGWAWINSAEETWNRRLEDLRDRLTAIDKATSELIESDPVQRGYRRELAGERRGVQKRIGEIGRTDAHGALVDLGLLPNYTLIDVSTTLEATLTWQEEDEEGGRRHHSELREYRRPASQALPTMRKSADRRRQRPAQGSQASSRHLSGQAR